MLIHLAEVDTGQRLSPRTSEQLEQIDQLDGGHKAHALAIGRHVTQHREQAVVQG